MMRLLPVAMFVYVMGGLLAGMLGLRNLAILAQPRMTPRPPDQAPMAVPLSPTVTAEHPRQVPLAVTPVRPTAAPPPADPGLGWSFLYAVAGDLWETSGQDPVQLTQNGQLGQPALGDTVLAFIERRPNASDLWVASADGPPEQVTQDASSIIAQNHWASQPAFLPGRQRAYVLGDFRASAVGVGDLAVWELSLQDGTVVQITRPPAYTGGDQDVTVNPRSPQQIIFTRYTYDGNQLVEQLQWLDVAVGTAVPLTQPDQPSRQASFSPDGTRVAFVQRDGSSENLYVANVLETGATVQLDGARVVVNGVICQPVWSPDGNGLAYVALTMNQFQLWYLDIRRTDDGTETIGQPRQLTSGPSVDATSRPVYLTAAQADEVRQWLAPLAP